MGAAHFALNPEVETTDDADDTDTGGNQRAK